MGPDNQILATSAAGPDDLDLYEPDTHPQPELCDSCRELVDDGGCFHDGRALCRSCLDQCPQCLDAMGEDWKLDH